MKRTYEETDEFVQYRGRLAPSPTGYLHLGHAFTFWTAQQRAREHGGQLILRIEDLDRERCTAKFHDALAEDLHWFGFQWSEGPDVGGSFAPYVQSERRSHYLEAWERLRTSGCIYPCRCSRRDVQTALSAPHEGSIGRPVLDEEPVYPGTCRPSPGHIAQAVVPAGSSWRFRVPDGMELCFTDERLGRQTAVAGRDFGDFVVWRKDNVPAYQLAVVADDAAMRITEVVRGEDLLMSTFRQLLIYRALGFTPPRWYHCPLIFDESGRRLAKRNDALSLYTLRAHGATPEEMRRKHGIDRRVQNNPTAIQAET